MPALKAGVRLGDLVFATDGIPMSRWGKDAFREHQCRGGETVVFDIERDGKRLTIPVKLEWPIEYPPKWPKRVVREIPD